MGGAEGITGGAPSRTLELRRGEAAPAELEKLKQIAAGFESIFTSTLLGELLKPMAGAGIAGEGPGASIVQGMLQSQLSDHVAKSGGFGIGAMVVKTLKPMLAARQVSAAELTSKLPVSMPQDVQQALAPAAAMQALPAAAGKLPRNQEDGR